MKKILVIITVLAISGFSKVQSQQIKIAHINTQELLASLPESDSAQAKIQQTASELQETLEEMQVEFNTKYQDYLQNSTTYTPIKRQAKEAELQDMNVRIQQFQENAEREIQEMRQKLLTPIIENTTKAIEEVGRESGYTYILDTSEGSTVIFSADNAVDIMEKVKAKLLAQ